MISAHRLPEDDFSALAAGMGDSAVIIRLLEAQFSKHLMLLHAVAEAAERADPASPEIRAFQAGYRLLARIQVTDPCAVNRQLSLPHTGSWAHDSLICIDRGSTPDFGYLAWIAAAAAVRAGADFELQVPVHDGRVMFPGLGCLRVPGADSWIRLCSTGKHLTAGEHVAIQSSALVPDDGTSMPVPHWQGTPLVRASADGRVWEVLLENIDRCLDRYTLPMLPAMSADEVALWRQRIEAAWGILVHHHPWAADPIREGVSVIVPLAPRSDLDSATTPAAFGAIATSLPPSPIITAETLVHEFQHIKLSGLMDMVPLAEPCDKKLYAPWRDDPRPASGLLQGLYAHLGIVRFWDAQRHLEVEPDGILRAEVNYERWRLALEEAAATLLETESLTSNGTRFVAMFREHGRSMNSSAVSAQAREIAREVALDHRLIWQFMHTALDPTEVAELAAAYQRGEPSDNRKLPTASVEEDARKIDPSLRSRLLAMSYLQPRQFRELRNTGFPELYGADLLLLKGNATAAVRAYGQEISTGAKPDAWIGLALAVHRLPLMPERQSFATQLPLMFDMHACLASQDVRSDPMHLAVWLR